MAQPPTGVITFLITDIVGSVALWQQDEAAMSTAVARHDALLRKLVRQHGGYVIKGTGDGIWTAFSDASAAIDAAVEIQTAMRAASSHGLPVLPVRVAIHTGDAEYRDGDYYGSTTNRVARLLEVTQGGQILVSDAALGRAGAGPVGHLRLRSLGRLRLRNFREPLATFEIMPHAGGGGSGPASATSSNVGTTTGLIAHGDIGLPVAPTSIGQATWPLTPFVPSYPFPTPRILVGRDAPLRRLEDILEYGRSRRQTVLIGAPAGTGKSALVGALVRRAQQAGVLCLTGGAYEQEGIIPLGPPREALADYLLTLPGEVIHDLLGQAVTDLAFAVPELTPHLRMPPSDEPSAQGDPGRLFGAFFSCLRALASRQPVLLCLEDLHAADGGTLALCQYLTRRPRHFPLVLVATFRTEEVQPGRDLARMIAALTRDGAQLIDLDPLNREQARQLISSLLDAYASERLVDSLYAATEGNPLFLEQTILALREEGRISRLGSVWHGNEDSRLILPNIVREVLERRVSRLSSRCRETVAMAAVLGQTVVHDVLVASLTPRSELDVIDDVEEAIRAHVLQEKPDGYAFAHALLRDAIYSSLSGRRKMLLHERAGDALERLSGDRASESAAELAHHFVRAGTKSTSLARALRYSLEAGSRAAALSLHREAIEHYTHACNLLEMQAEEGDFTLLIETLEARGTAERFLGLWHASIQTFERILTLAREPTRRANAFGALGRAQQEINDMPAALAAYDAGLAEVAPVADAPAAVPIRLALVFDRAFAHLLQGKFADALQAGRIILDVAERADDPQLLYRGYCVVALAHMWSGRMAEAAQEYELAMRGAERSGSKMLLAGAHENFGTQRYLSGQIPEARALIEQAASLYRDAAGEQRTVLACQRLCRIWLAHGDLDRAFEAGERGRAMSLEGGDRLTAECNAALGAVHSTRADWDEAEVCFEQALAVHRRVGHLVGATDSLSGLGLVHERRGNWQRARELYQEAVEIAAGMDPCVRTVLAGRHLGRLLLRLGHRDAATDILGRTLDLAEQIPLSIEYAPTLLAVAELRRPHDLDDALRLAERALQAPRTAETSIEIGASLASWYVDAGRLDDAVKQVAVTLVGAERLNAPLACGLANLAAGRLVAAQGDDGRAEQVLRVALGHLTVAQTPYERSAALSELADVIERASRDASQPTVMRREAATLLAQIGVRRPGTSHAIGSTPIA